MNEAWHALVGILAVLGALFCVIAAIGVARLPDALTRMHASSKAGTLGCGLILAGVALFHPQVDVLARVIAAILFLLLTTPVSAHMIGRAIHASRERLWSGTVRDELRGTKDDPGERLGRKH
ncbi:monovalent cation/H(+) antiporter subunit G [Niveispirillum sp. KHB5.9]|uniref:monovalent cation/H(+) antiporter subunit G n=1 Tax=Niveispirillum sp. KHB5.9 TaxID=3400269 RepID=UPI003A88EFB2